MAVTNNEWKVIEFTAEADALTGRMKIRYLRWEAIATAAHNLVVNTTAGANIATVAAETDDRVVEIPVNEMVNGIVVTTMDSGKLIAYLD